MQDLKYVFSKLINRIDIPCESEKRVFYLHNVYVSFVNGHLHTSIKCFFSRQNSGSAEMKMLID